MPTPVFVCGAECGIAAAGTASAGVEHWTTFGAGVTNVTSGPSPMVSTRCFRCDNTASTGLVHVYATSIASPATMVARFKIYFATLPSASVAILCTSGGTSGQSWGVYFDQASGQLRAGRSTTLTSTGVAVTTGQWYRVDLKVSFAATHTADIQVDGTAGTQNSTAVAAEASPQLNIGSSSILGSGLYYLDDIIVSGTSADYPIGDGTVAGLYPVSDGTHGGGWASGVFGKGSGGATAAQNTNTDIWQSLQNPLSTTIPTNFVSDLTGTATTNYVEFVLGDLPANALTVNGAMVVATLHAATATASNHSLNLANTGGSSVSLFSLSFNTATITVPIVVRTTDAAGAAWDVTKINDARIRFSSTDSNPDVYLDGVCFEVDYIASVAAAYPVLVNKARRM